MHNPVNDNELDSLSREASERYDVPTNPNWRQMQEALDMSQPVKKPSRKTGQFWWWLPMLILVLGGVSYWWRGSEKPAAAATVIAKNNAPHVMPAPDNNPKLPVSPGNHPTLQPGKSSSVPIALKSPFPLRETQQPAITTFSATAKKYSQSPAEQPADQRPGLKNAVRGSNPEGRQAVAGNEETPRSGTSTDVQKESPTLNISSGTATGSQTIAAQVTVKTSADNITLEKSDARKTTQAIASKGKGWSYAILAGVDKSTVKFRYGNDPGYNLGFLAGYHVNSRLSVHTGAIYTQKNYKLAGEDFTAPKGSWVSYYKLENVDGYCRMWEVPLLARYTVSEHGKNSIFLSTGLSSYFMTKENYSYFYYYNGLPITRNSVYASSDTHILSVIHLSAGFENRVTNNLSLQIEPYAKIPIEGVGFGNIQLSSFGVNFSLQSRQSSKKIKSALHN